MNTEKKDALRSQQEPEESDVFAAVLAEARRLAPNGQAGESRDYTRGWRDVLEFIARHYKEPRLRAYVLSAAPTEAEGMAEKIPLQRFHYELKASGERHLVERRDGAFVRYSDVRAILASSIQQAPSGESVIHEWRFNTDPFWHQGIPANTTQDDAKVFGVPIETRTLYTAPVVPARAQEDGALVAALAALERSTPKMSHYPEAVARHRAAIEGARAALAARTQGAK